MKKNCFIALLLLIILVLSSCSITKRNYVKGFYFQKHWHLRKTNRLKSIDKNKTDQLKFSFEKSNCLPHEISFLELEESGDSLVNVIEISSTMYPRQYKNVDPDSKITLPKIGKKVFSSSTYEENTAQKKIVIPVRKPAISVSFDINNFFLTVLIILFIASMLIIPGLAIYFFFVFLIPVASINIILFCLLMDFLAAFYGGALTSFFDWNGDFDETFEKIFIYSIGIETGIGLLILAGYGISLLFATVTIWVTIGLIAGLILLLLLVFLLILISGMKWA